MHDASSRHALVFAIAHELGNHLAGIRLEAHLLDEAMGALGLARASLAIDGLAGRSAPLLALIRPLLAPARRPTGPLVLADVLDGVRRALEDAGTAGRPVEVRIETDPAARAPAFDGLHALLLALVGAPDELPAGRGAIVLGLGRRGASLEVACALPGEAFDEAFEAGLGDGRDPLAPSALRGRALAVALARVLVADAGGRVELVRVGEGAKLSLLLPVEGS
jgi:nitrogen-specific signal transduction histidine kinase